MLLTFSTAPMTSNRPGGPVSRAIAAVVETVRESGLPHKTTSMFTTTRDRWGEVMSVVERCVNVIAKRSPQISLVMKADIRPGYTGQIAVRVERASEILENG